MAAIEQSHQFAFYTNLVMLPNDKNKQIVYDITDIDLIHRIKIV